MVEQRNYLFEARDALCCTDEPLRQRLSTAAKLFRRAYIYRAAHWPPEAQEEAGDLLAALVADGKMIRNLNEMDDARVSQLCHQLMNFLDRHDLDLA